MSLQNQKPNSDAANEGSLPGGISAAIESYFLNEFEGMLPATVVSYDDATNRAVIKPLVMVGTTDNRKVSRAEVANIPVYRFGGGGFFMRFPVKAGDLGWLKANDRDISLIFQRQGGEDWPNTTRKHKFSDAMFFPDTFKDWVINGANVDAAVWQSTDGDVSIAMAGASLKLSIGAVSIEITAAGVDIISPPGTLRHNGINVGDTHQHIGSPTAPLGPVSPTGFPVP
jgi:hypothetical protein